MFTRKNAVRSITSALAVLLLSAWVSGANAGAEKVPGKAFKDCPDCPEMVIVPKPFAISKFEVTQGEWRAVMGSNPSKFKNCGDTCPVEQVSWNDVQKFIQKLNTKTGKQYRLPSEAEWEYACYGGSQTKYCGGNDIDAVGWYSNSGNPGGNSNLTTHPVGQRQANGYGLYDMTGNVDEWTETVSCQQGDCERRTFRGCSWPCSPEDSLAHNISNGRMDRGNSNLGFRLVIMLDKDFAEKQQIRTEQEAEKAIAEADRAKAKIDQPVLKLEIQKSPSQAEKLKAGKDAEEARLKAEKDAGNTAIAERKAEAAKEAAANAAREEAVRQWCIADKTRLSECKCSKYSPVKGGSACGL